QRRTLDLRLFGSTSTRERGRYLSGLKCFRCLQARRNFGDAYRPPEAKALHRVHARGTQEKLLVGCFDAFGRDFHAEAAAEADDGVHDGCGIGRLLDRADETAVDLEFVEGEAP